MHLDVATGRRLYGLDGLNDADIARVMFEKRREETGDSEFLRHHLHRIITISAVLRHGESLRVWSLGDAEASEAELVRRFFDGIEKFTPTLVSWNGGQFDLPVLHYRALLHGIAAPRYWDTGDVDRSRSCTRCSTSRPTTSTASFVGIITSVVFMSATRI